MDILNMSFLKVTPNPLITFITLKRSQIKPSLLLHNKLSKNTL